MKQVTSLSPEQATVLDRDSCYRAVAAKDTRFDGVFFTGVKTTGIYCRPVCSAKTPRQSSCQFFNSAAAAESAGFRPCLRCRPELAPYALQQNLAYAVWQRIAAGGMNGKDEESTTETLAAQIGLSSRQLRRVLLQHFGVTPIELAQTQRLLFAKKLLQETRLPMADVAFASGFGSVRRFNALFASRYGLAPGAVRRAGQAEEIQPGSLTLRLAYRPPFAWREMLDYLGGRAIPGVEAVDLEQSSSAYLRTVQIGGLSGWLRVTHLEQRGQLQVDAAPSLAPLLMPLLARVRSQFDLDANPSVIESHLREDPMLARLIKATPGLRVPGAFDSFELAVRAVLGQQVSVAGASTLAARLVQRYGASAVTPWDKLTRHFPVPQVLAAADDIAGIGLPAARGQTIRRLAEFAASGGLEFKPGASLVAVISHLKSVAGIGDWTAHYIALRALRFPDAFPAGDLGLQKAAANAGAGAKVAARFTEKQLHARAEAWSPWRAYAALLLWRSLRGHDAAQASNNGKEKS
jgi:AraC family transcriptional regulator of adaptative response / DNA-3-methyladenine glycosylase II